MKLQELKSEEQSEVNGGIMRVPVQQHGIYTAGTAAPVFGNDTVKDAPNPGEPTNGWMLGPMEAQ